MTTEFVGLEAIPNTYISKVIINKGQFGSYYGEAHVYVRDFAGEDGFLWSGSQAILERMRFMFMSVEGDGNINNVTSGFYNLSDLMKLPNLATNGTTIQYRDVKICKRFTRGADVFYKTVFKFNINPWTLNQAIFCCLFMKSPTFSGQNSIVNQYTMDLKGPTTSEYILKGGSIGFASNVFIKENGEQWPGPVHFHPSSGYMKGAVHTEETHGIVRKQAIPNLKIINNINFNFNLKTALNKPRYTPATKLWSTFTNAGGVSGVFGINYKNILIRKTKYGHSLMNLENADLLSFVDKMKVNFLAIKRHKVKISKNKKSKVLESRQIINSFTDDFGNFKEVIILSKDAGPNRTVFLDNLRSAEGLEIVDENEIFWSDLETGEIKSAIKEIPLSVKKAEGMKFYQFEDYEITTNSFGDYSYQVMVRFKDPTIEYVNSMVKEARDGLSSLKNYLIRILSENNYDYNMNGLKGSFIEKERQLYINDLTFAPWVSVVKNYCKYLSFLHDLKQDQIEYLINTNSPKIHPKTATLASIKMFIGQYEKVLNKLYKHFDISTAKLTSGRSSDRLKSFKDPRTNIISVEHHFKEIINTKDAKVFYNYFSPNGNSVSRAPASSATELLFINKPELQARLIRERAKFGAAVSTKIISPLSVQRGNHIIAINKNLYAEEYIRQLNLFFKNIILQEIPQDPVVIEETTPEPVVSLDIHIPSKEILGDDTKFSNVESQEDICMKQFDAKSPQSYAQHAAVQAAAGENKAIPDSLVRAFVMATGEDLPDAFAETEWVGKPEEVINVYVNHHMIHTVEVLDNFMEGYLDNWREITDEDLSGDREFLCRIKHIGPGWPVSGSPLERATKLPTSVNKYFFLSTSPDELTKVDSAGTKQPTRDRYNVSIIDSLQYNIHLSTSNIIKQNIKTDTAKSTFVTPENLNEEENITDIPRYATNILRSFDERQGSTDTMSVGSDSDEILYDIGAGATTTGGMGGTGGGY